MFGTLKTLFIGEQARLEERVRDTYAIELIDQKIRETEHSLNAAKTTLASLIQRERGEAKLLKSLHSQAKQMETRAAAALEAGNETLALEAADAIARMENEMTIRTETVDRLKEKITRLQTSVQIGHRKVVELKQGAISAQAIRREAKAQSHLSKSGFGQTSAQEAEDLIAKVVGADDPFEMGQIMEDINAGLSGDTLADRMAAEGFGPQTKSTAADVLARLKK